MYVFKGIIILIKLTFILVIVQIIIIDGTTESGFKCQKSKPDYQSCALTNLIRFIPHTLMGIPEFNISKSDPLDIPYMFFNRSILVDTHIVAILKNLRFKGFSNIVIHNVTITNLHDMTGELAITLPNVNLTMEHFFGGQLFSIPLGIEGDFSGNFTDDFTHMKVKYKSVERGGQEYFSIDKIKMRDHIADGRIRMIAKDPENQPFSNFMNNFFNNNPRPILDVFSLLYMNSLEDILSIIVNRALAMIPADTLFA